MKGEKRKERKLFRRGRNRQGGFVSFNHREVERKSFKKTRSAKGKGA